MAIAELPPIEFLRECFDYDPGTGVVRWKKRPLRHFADASRGKTWNAKYPGRTGCDRAKDGYVRFHLTYEGRPRRVMAHRLAIALSEGTTTFAEVDHRNLQPSDNALANLRLADRSKNGANRRGHAKTGLPKGVTKRGKRFSASASANGQTLYLGTHDTIAGAHRAYRDFAREQHGEFFNSGESRFTAFD